MADLNENKLDPSAEALAKAGYKKTKVGWIPEEWAAKKLRELIKSLESGVSLNGEERKLKSGEIAVLKVSSVSYGVFNPNEYKVILESDRKRAKTNPQKGKILVSRANTPELVAASAYLNQDYHQLFLPDKLWQTNFHKDGDVESLYVYYLLQTHRSRNRLSNLATGSSGSMKNISKGAFLSLTIPLPPLPEQRGIARILSTWDAAIDKLGQLIAKKQALKKGLMQQLLSGRVRFPEFVPPGGTRYKETKVGVVPEDWEVVRIRDVVKEVKRDFSWDDEAKYDLISIRRRSGGVFYRDSLYGHQIKTKTLKPVHEDDFLISKMQIVHGASGLVSSEFDGMMASASYIIMRTKNEDMLDIRFLDLLSRLPWFYHLTYLSSHGVHIEKMTFDFKDFLKRSIYLPPIAEQRRIVECIYSSEREIESLQKEQSYLRTQKKGLMQQLLTGAVRVKEGIANESFIDENS